MYMNILLDYCICCIGTMKQLNVKRPFAPTMNTTLLTSPENFSNCFLNPAQDIMAVALAQLATSLVPKCREVLANLASCHVGAYYLMGPPELTTMTWITLL